MSEKEELEVGAVKQYILLGILYIWRKTGNVADIQPDGSFRIPDSALKVMMRLKDFGLLTVKKQLETQGLIKFEQVQGIPESTRYWLT
ncbi:MAG: hypothetical protein Q7O04_01945 [Candidatus Omnitrophota bacterium]|nr:hypothetical protein [Candidatus Omnitrophota bacterium]